MRRYTTLGLAGLIVVGAIALLVFTFYPAVGSATKPLNPLVETAISQPTPVMQPGIVSLTTALLAALKQEDVGGPGMARMRGLPTAIYARLMERSAAEAFAAGYSATYDASVDMKTPVWLIILVGDAVSSGEIGMKLVPISQMIFVIDGQTAETVFGTDKALGDELDLSTFTKVAIPAEYVPPEYDQLLPSPTPIQIIGPPPTMPTNLHIAYPPPGTTEQAYPAPTSAQP